MRFTFAILALLGLAAATPTDPESLFARTSCSTPDGSGTCKDTSACTGFHVAGYCPGGTSNQCCISKTCSTSSGSGVCKNTGSGCSGGGFIAGACPGDSTIQCCVKGASGSGGINKPISRTEIISRGEFWINKHVPYSQSKDYPDPQGTEYRTDCSGFVSMALHTNHPGYTTVSMPSIAKEISWDDLQPGDFVGTLGPASDGSNTGGHVTLFKSWTSSAKTRYNTLECRGTAYGCIAYERPIKWTEDGRVSKPYKYIRVE